MSQAAKQWVLGCNLNDQYFGENFCILNKMFSILTELFSIIWLFLINKWSVNKLNVQLVNQIKGKNATRFLLPITSTVKPVYNGHPRDLKNVAVMHRDVWKRSVVSRLQAGRYSGR